MVKNRGIIIFFVLLILAVLVWGFIGGQQAKDVGITCDMGLGDSLCWKWHQNVVGEVQEFLGDTGNAVKDISN